MPIRHHKTTDKWIEKKKKQGDGQGDGSDYRPWVRVGDFGSRGRMHRIAGVDARIHHFMSDLERDYYYWLLWNDHVVDIKEQYPLSLDETRKIAEELGTIGHMKELKRIQVGEFNIKDSITIEELENQEIVSNKFITIEKYFSNYENIVLNERKFQLFLNGVQLTYELKDGIYKIYKENEFIGIGTVKNKLLKRDIII